MTEGCGQIDTNGRSTSIEINYHLVSVTGIVEFRKRTTDDQVVSVEDRKAAACKMHTRTRITCT